MFITAKELVEQNDELLFMLLLIASGWTAMGIPT